MSSFKTIILISILFVLASCAKSIPQKLDDFVDEVEQNSSSFTESDWEEASTQYAQLVNEYLTSDKEFTDEQKELAAKAMGRYHINIGNVYYAMGRYEEALDMYQKSLTISLKVYGEGHPDVALLYHNIGVVYSHLDRFEEALDMYRKSLSIRLKVYGEGHPDVAMLYHNIGHVYDDLGRYEEALEMYQKSRDVSDELGDSNGVAFNDYLIGSIEGEKGHTLKAKQYLNEAIKIWTELYGPDYEYVQQAQELLKPL